MKLNMERLINQRFECPTCRVSGTWDAAARTMIRDESIIQNFRCRRCHEEVVAKAPRSRGDSKTSKDLATREYLVLRELLTTFPQDDCFGTLTPLACVESEDGAALITQKFDGVDLVQYASRGTAHREVGLCRSAGILLRKLHDSCLRGYERQPLGVQAKLLFLAKTYADDLRRDASMRTLFDALERHGVSLSALRLTTTWSHGDFKPENVLFGGHKFVIMDTTLEGTGPAVYDVASFLNHLLISGKRNTVCKLCGGYQQAEQEFLDGYGGVGEEELTALRWAQLYFMLHYWGRYRKRGALGVTYAKWKIKPIAQNVATWL